MDKLCKDIKKYFQEIGFKRLDEEDKNGVYRIESELEMDSKNFTVAIMHHKKPRTITFQINSEYRFNKNNFPKTLFIADLINMTLMNIGSIAINLETAEITITSNLYLSNKGVNEYQFKSTLKRIFNQLQLCRDLIQKVDQDNEDPLEVIIDFDDEIWEAMKPKPEDQPDFVDQYFVDIPGRVSLKDDRELIVMDMQLCLQNEGLPIINEAEHQNESKNRSTQIVESWFKFNSQVFRLQALYTPETDIVGFEISGFQPIKDEYASNYIYLFNWINQMQMRNWWVLCPEINQILFRGGFVISDGKLVKYQFSKLIKNSIENLKLFYPLVVDQENVGKDVVDSILRFSGDNIIKIGRFHNK